MKTLALMTLAVLALAACGAKTDTQAPAGPACPAGTVCEAQLPDATAAATYYKQFHYEVLGDCAKPASVRFAWLGFADRAVISTSDDGQEVVAEVNVFMNDDGTYTGEYQENTQKEVEDGVWETTDSKNRRDLKGTWTVSEITDKQKDKHGKLLKDAKDVKIQAIDLSGIGLGRNVTSENWAAIALQFGSELNPALNGKTFTLVHVRSMISKDAQTPEAYCQAQKPSATTPPAPAAGPKAGN